MLGRTAAPPLVPAPGRARAGILGYLRDEQVRYGYFFIFPTLLFFCVFVAFPLAFSFYLSFHSWNPLSDQKTFVGLDNYAELLRSESFLGSVLNTIVFTAGVVGLTALFSLLLASALNQGLRGTGLFRGIFYSPVVTSFVATGLVWLWLLDPGYGAINHMLGLVGLPRPGWASDPAWAMPTVILTFAWREVGYFTIVYLAGLQSIPETLKEAARIDGATTWQVFRRITFPLLIPTTLFVVVLGVIRATQISFGLIYVMTGGGPVGATNVMVLYLYQQAFEFFRMGYASAVAYVLFAFIFVVTLIQFRVLERRAQF
jgi:multiple sugar transport system permease protein